MYSAVEHFQSVFNIPSGLQALPDEPGSLSVQVRNVLNREATMLACVTDGPEMLIPAALLGRKEHQTHKHGHWVGVLTSRRKRLHRLQSVAMQNDPSGRTLLTGHSSFILHCR